MGTPRRLRVFVDANILIRGITFPRYPYEILRLAARHTIVLVVSPSVLADARRYLTLLFPEHLPKLDGFLATALTETIADPAMEEVVNHRDLVRDFKDVPVVMAAAAAGVDFLISTDADLTDANESTAALRQFVAPGRVMRPGAFLSDIIGWSHDDLEAISRRDWRDLRGDLWGG
jgi:predicted nucleic acid-binding protein